MSLIDIKEDFGYTSLANGDSAKDEWRFVKTKPVDDILKHKETDKTKSGYDPRGDLQIYSVSREKFISIRGPELENWTFGFSMWVLPRDEINGIRTYWWRENLNQKAESTRLIYDYWIEDYDFIKDEDLLI